MIKSYFVTKIRIIVISPCWITRIGNLGRWRRSNCRIRCFTQERTQLILTIIRIPFSISSWYSHALSAITRLTFKQIKIKMNKKWNNINNYKHNTSDRVKEEPSINCKITNIKPWEKFKKTDRTSQNNFIEDKKRK